jgi:hypothetical protein
LKLTNDLAGERQGGLLKIRKQVEINIRARERQHQRILLFAFCSITFVSMLVYRTYLEKKDAPTLAFQNSSLATVISTLENEYDVRIDVEQRQILQCNFNGAFYKIKTPAELIESLSAVLGLKYEIIGDKEYRLHGRICAM